MVLIGSTHVWTGPVFIKKDALRDLFSLPPNFNSVCSPIQNEIGCETALWRLLLLPPTLSENGLRHRYSWGHEERLDFLAVSMSRTNHSSNIVIFIVPLTTVTDRLHALDCSPWEVGQLPSSWRMEMCGCLRQPLWVMRQRQNWMKWVLSSESYPSPNSFCNDRFDNLKIYCWCRRGA